MGRLRGGRLPGDHLSENALFPLVCVWLLALCGLLGARSPRAGFLASIAFALAASALWVVHYRMGGALVVSAAVLIWLGLRRRVAPQAVVAALLVIAVAVWATSLLDHFLIDHNYGGQAEGEASERFDQLTTAGGAGNGLLNLVGQSWYLLVSTFGLAAIVIADTWAKARLWRAHRGDGPSPIVVALLALAAILLLPRRPRSQNAAAPTC
jgi:hypothetical protein